MNLSVIETKAVVNTATIVKIRNKSRSKLAKILIYLTGEQMDNFQYTMRLLLVERIDSGLSRNQYL